MWEDLIFCILFSILAIWDYCMLVNNENTKFEEYALVLLITINLICAVIDCIKFLGKVL